MGISLISRSSTNQDGYQTSIVFIGQQLSVHQISRGCNVSTRHGTHADISPQVTASSVDRQPHSLFMHLDPNSPKDQQATCLSENLCSRAVSIKHCYFSEVRCRQVLGSRSYTVENSRTSCAEHRIESTSLQCNLYGFNGPTLRPGLNLLQCKRGCDGFLHQSTDTTSKDLQRACTHAQECCSPRTVPSYDKGEQLS